MTLESYRTNECILIVWLVFLPEKSQSKFHFVGVYLAAAVQVDDVEYLIISHPQTGRQAGRERKKEGHRGGREEVSQSM